MSAKLLNLLINLLTAAIAAIPLFYTIMLDKKKNKNKNKSFFQRIKTPGWIIIIAALVIMGLGYWKDSLSEKEAKRDRDDFKKEITASFDTSLERYNLKYNPSTGTVSKRDTTVIISKESRVKPLLKVIGNPIFNIVSKNDGRVPISILVKNTQPVIAKNITHKIVCVQKNIDGLIGLNDDIIGESKVQNYVSNDGIQHYIIDYKYRDIDKNTTTYFYFKLVYTDEFGEFQLPLWNIYVLDYPNKIQSVFSTKSNDFNKIRKFLVDNEYW